MSNAIILTEYEMGILQTPLRQEVSKYEGILRSFPPDDSVWKANNRVRIEEYLKDIKRLLQKLESKEEVGE
jgi:hypothetical protein